MKSIHDLAKQVPKELYGHCCGTQRVRCCAVALPCVEGGRGEYEVMKVGEYFPTNKPSTGFSEMQSLLFCALKGVLCCVTAVLCYVGGPPEALSRRRVGCGARGPASVRD